MHIANGREAAWLNSGRASTYRHGPRQLALLLLWPTVVGSTAVADDGYPSYIKGDDGRRPPHPCRSLPPPSDLPLVSFFAF
jgi:hypothetical protein